ncbi:hypothetical protein BFP76_03150 [Amylibacter kogurei]|uniref:Co-chaperone DjlA N-terminal domain-containing protein n=1 Tax=Paramylibacter kogurei TaxID=1889778 RepID=A0A2G5K868_9RHOB|nr:hypothetical protein [Amylibacter kogurei]PIB25070.1 hypothetical protein BFP76_03150 [Amylibacter kogurei]
MHIILGLLAIAGALYFYVMRARNAAHMASELMDVANDVRLAARRFGFKRKMNVHPVEGLDDGNVAIAAIATAFLELDNLPTADQRDHFLVQLQSKFDLDHTSAEELAVLGRWLSDQCQSPSGAITRITRRLYKLEGTPAFEPLLTLINDTMNAANSTLSDRQRDALDDIKRALKL